MMKTVLVSTLALVAGASVASAGGYTLPVVETPVAVVAAPAPVRNWEGAYVGGTLSFGSGDDRVGVAPNVDADVYSPGTLNLSGSNYGLRAGYRWQRELRDKPVVFGVELGYEVGGMSDKFTANGYDAAVSANSVMAVRFKTGMLNEAQNTLFYGIQGLAQGDFDYKVVGSGAGGAMNYDDSYSASGYILGFGIERRVSERVSITGEYEYANFGKTDLIDASGAVTRATPKWNSLKLGVNFRF